MSEQSEENDSGVKYSIRNGLPFRLDTESAVRLAEIPREDWYQVSKALAAEKDPFWSIETSEDIPFLASVLREENNIELLHLFLDREEVWQDNETADLMAALQSSHVTCIDIRKKTPNCHAESLLRGLRHLSTLRSLFISYNLSPDEYQPLAQALQNPNLKELEIWSDTATMWPVLIPVLAEHPSLELLEMRSYNLGVYEAVAEILASNRSIQTVVLALDELEDNGAMEKLCSSLVQNTTLKKLVVRGLTEHAANLLFATLANNATTLVKCKLTDTDLTNKNMDVLAGSLRTNTRLQMLNLSHCKINHESCQLLCGGLVRNNSLKALNLLYNLELQTAGFNALWGYLQQNTSLTELNLQSTKLADQDCKGLADVLSVNKTLRTLNISRNAFQDDGLQFLCPALDANTTLTALDIKVNKFGGAGMTGVKDLLARNTVLQRLKISYYEPEHLLLLFDALKQNNSLRFISAMPCEVQHKITGDELTILLQTLTDNYALDGVELAWHKEKSEEISKLFDRNKHLKSETKFKVAALSHNIARSKEIIGTLPREMWVEILSSVTHPGMSSFRPLVESIFANYTEE